MRVLAFVSFFALFIATQARAQQFGGADHDSTFASMISLIASPERSQGKKVRVIGVWRLEKENQSLCLSHEDFIHYISENCLWVEPNYAALKIDEKTLMDLNGKYVLVEGTFNKDNTGQMGMWAGAIEGVTRVGPWH